MTDIKERLRENADLDAMEHCNPIVIALEREAADEIERLEAGIEKILAVNTRIQKERADLQQALLAIPDLADLRNKALEEAASVCMARAKWEQGEADDSSNLTGTRDHCRVLQVESTACANAIRALKTISGEVA